MELAWNFWSYISSNQTALSRLCDFTTIFRFSFTYAINALYKYVKRLRGGLNLHIKISNTIARIETLTKYDRIKIRFYSGNKSSSFVIFWTMLESTRSTFLMSLCYVTMQNLHDGRPHNAKTDACYCSRNPWNYSKATALRLNLYPSLQRACADTCYSPGCCKWNSIWISLCWRNLKVFPRKTYLMTVPLRARRGVLVLNFPGVP